MTASDTFRYRKYLLSLRGNLCIVSLHFNSKYLLIYYILHDCLKILLKADSTLVVLEHSESHIEA